LQRIAQQLRLFFRASIGTGGWAITGLLKRWTEVLVKGAADRIRRGEPFFGFGDLPFVDHPHNK
jgi:hypothetical protein